MPSDLPETVGVSEDGCGGIEIRVGHPDHGDIAYAALTADEAIVVAERLLKLARDVREQNAKGKRNAR